MVLSQNLFLQNQFVTGFLLGSQFKSFLFNAPPTEHAVCGTAAALWAPITNYPSLLEFPRPWTQGSPQNSPSALGFAAARPGPVLYDQAAAPRAVIRFRNLAPSTVRLMALRSDQRNCPWELPSARLAHGGLDWEGLLYGTAGSWL